jgi:hypothetical protein
LKMAQNLAGRVEDSCCGAVLVVAEVVVAAVVVGSVAVLVAYRRPCMRCTVLEELDLMDNAVEALYALSDAAVLMEAPVSLERLPVHSIHSFHDHDRWLRGFVLVEAAEILTWAERGMPFFEHCRTPLYPNSDREKSAPDLIFPDVRRERYSKYRDKPLRIAWKRLL